MVLLYAVADVAIEIPTLLLHHLPHRPLQLLRRVQGSLAVHAVAWLLVDEVALGAGQLEGRVDGLD
jgi:hypothetical protein